jgi:hypothetical protein
MSISLQVVNVLLVALFTERSEGPTFTNNHDAAQAMPAGADHTREYHNANLSQGS